VVRHPKERPRIYAWDVAAGAVGATVAVVLTATTVMSGLAVLLAFFAGSWLGPVLLGQVLGPSLPDNNRSRLVRAIVVAAGCLVGSVMALVLWPPGLDDSRSVFDLARWLVLVAAAGSFAYVLLAATQRSGRPAPASIAS
jgi:hypothetical protein